MADISFSTVFGHHEQLEQLTSAYRANRLPHALLFSGPAAIGKRHVALALAEQLLGGDPRSRALVRAGTHPDLHLLFVEDEKKEISVDAVRELSRKLHLRPYASGPAVAIIDNAHLLSLSACNALLMTLEEPPAHGFLLLVSHLAHRLPPTILSRCQPIFFAPLDDRALLNIARMLLLPIVENEGTLAELLRLCDGSLEPLALSPFIDPRSSFVTRPAELKEHLLGLAQEAKSIKVKVAHLLSGTAPASSALSIAAELTEKDRSPQVVWGCLRQLVREALLKSTPATVANAAKQLRETLRTEQLITERNLNPQLQLSQLLVQLAAGCARDSSAAPQARA